MKMLIFITYCIYNVCTCKKKVNADWRFERGLIKGCVVENAYGNNPAWW